MKPFTNTKEVFEEQINDIFSKSTDEKNDLIIQSLSLLLKMPDSNSDLNDLYNLVGLENFVRVISLFENKTIKFPSKSEVKDIILTSLLFYYREVEKLDWNEIKTKVPFDFSSISYASKIKKMNLFMKKKLFDILTEEE